MSNKYDGNGNLKGDANGNRVLLGLVMHDGKLVLDYDKEAPLHELARFHGILSMETPFLLQMLKAKKAQSEKSEILTPSRE